MSQRAPGGQVGTPQGSGSKGKKSCSQAFVGPTKAEGISPVQISPPESMDVRLSVCVPCLYLSVCTHYLWTCTFPKIHHPLPHLFFQVPLMGLLALGALTPLPSCGLSTGRPTTAWPACPMMSPSPLAPVGSLQDGESGAVVRAWLGSGQNLPCADQAQAPGLSQHLFLPAGPP